MHGDGGDDRPEGSPLQPFPRQQPLGAATGPAGSPPTRPPSAPWTETESQGIPSEPSSAGSDVEDPATSPRDITPAAPEPGDDDDGKGGVGSFLRELPILILIAFALAMLIKTFFVQAFYIPSESMLPTLEVEDRVLVNKLVYRFREPRRGEVVVFVGEHDERERSFLQRIRDSITEGLGAASSPEKDFIKRVIALPGETIEITEAGEVLITQRDGSRLRLDEPYLASRDPDDDAEFGPYTVPADEYFVMGDNRANSADSRTDLGPIPKSDIVGKAFVRIWPVRRFGFFRTPPYEAAAAAFTPIAAFALAGGLGGVRRRRVCGEGPRSSRPRRVGRYPHVDGARRTLRGPTARRRVPAGRRGR